ncbi:MAG: glycosyltransferase family 1 protein, partial [Planctomycetes bacterium]|nr:glycosyltransferase family 1 protein [Planctomycetota bacterium]
KSKQLRILFVGSGGYGSTSSMRMRVLKELGHDVSHIEAIGGIDTRGWFQLYRRITHRLGYPVDYASINKALLEQVTVDSYDIIWIETVNLIRAETLKRIRLRCPSAYLVGFIMDDPFSKFVHGWKRFKKSARWYDVHFVIRDQNIDELKAIGASQVMRYHKGYDPGTHRPVELPVGYPQREVLFAGHREDKREAEIAFLLAHNVQLTVTGQYDWRRDGRYWEQIGPRFIEKQFQGDEYAQLLCSAKIALCFYSQWNRDRENSRMYEIPACGIFMLAERNQENIEVFAEGKEAEFFSDRKELLDKIRYYLAHRQERCDIAEAGYRRCQSSGYSYAVRMQKMLEQIVRLRKTC